MISDQSVAMAEHESETECIEEKAAEASIDDAFHQYVHRFPRPAEAGLKHREANLHTKNKEGRNKSPHRINRVDYVVAFQRGIGGKHSQSKEVRIEQVSGGREDSNASYFSGKKNHAVTPPFRAPQTLPDTATPRLFPFTPVHTIKSSYRKHHETQDEYADKPR